MTWTTWLADIAIKSSAVLLLALLVNRLLLRRAPAAVVCAVARERARDQGGSGSVGV